MGEIDWIHRACVSCDSASYALFILVQLDSRDMYSVEVEATVCISL